MDGVLDLKRGKHKKQEGKIGDWLYEGNEIDDGRSAPPYALLRRHLGHINGAVLRGTMAAALRGKG